MASQCGHHRIATRWKGLLANSCFGLKKVFKEEWNIPYNVKISEEKPYTMTVGGELALTAHVSPGEVVHEWHGA